MPRRPSFIPPNFPKLGIPCLFPCTFPVQFAWILKGKATPASTMVTCPPRKPRGRDRRSWSPATLSMALRNEGYENDMNMGQTTTQRLRIRMGSAGSWQALGCAHILSILPINSKERTATKSTTTSVYATIFLLYVGVI